MVLIDSSVWIGLLRGVEEDVREVGLLVRGASRAVVCGPVVQEVLQGIREDMAREKVALRLRAFPFLESTWDHYASAATLYARLRSAGVTVPAVDALIAVHAIRANIALFTRDKHFGLMCQYSSLALYTPSSS